MSAEKDWLTMLQNATSYGDLQTVFARMSVESQSTDDGDAMVASIDEAIRRIEQERARDQTELDGVSSDYEAFKQQQSGVIGWFKRKLPFTETRQQELGHRDALNDQAAEILADNFIIARAQMLKERIASSRFRRMGHQSSYWRSQFLHTDSVNSIGEYGNVVYELGKELAVAKLFVDTVAIDIEAFSAAKFINREDQIKCHDDLNAARSELKALVDERQDKVNLRISALATLKSLLITELSEKDSDFRNTNQRLTLLRSLQDKLPRLAKLLEESLAIVKALVAKMVEKDSLPERREKVQKAINTLKRDWDEAERRRLRAFSELNGPSQSYNDALKESQQAKAALSATKPLYDAYIAEQNRASPNTAEVTSEVDFEVSPSSVVTEYRRLEEAATTAAQTLSHRTPSFDQAKRTHDNAVNEANEIRDKSEAQVLELNKIEKLESELQQQLLKAKQNIESTFPEFRIAADSYLDDARKITWADTSGTSVRSIQELLNDYASSGFSSSPFSLERSTMPSTATKGLTDMRRNYEHLERAIQAIETDRKACLREVATLSNLRKEVLQRRGQMLLNQSVFSELDLD